MKTIKLTRVAYIDDGTFGVLFDEDTPFCLTLEREWRDNKRGESCIPAGQYICRKVKSPKFGDTFEICDVPDRSHILFHKGNLEDDSHGCILVGEMYEKFKDKNAILASGRAWSEFRERLRHLRIFNFYIRDSE
jgi:hypothetical protein